MDSQKAASGAVDFRAHWERSERYPDPAIEIVEPNFARYRIFNASVERLASDCRRRIELY